MAKTWLVTCSPRDLRVGTGRPALGSGDLVVATARHAERLDLLVREHENRPLDQLVISDQRGSAAAFPTNAELPHLAVHCALRLAGNPAAAAGKDPGTCEGTGQNRNPDLMPMLLVDTIKILM